MFLKIISFSGHQEWRARRGARNFRADDPAEPSAEENEIFLQEISGVRDESRRPTPNRQSPKESARLR